MEDEERAVYEKLAKIGYEAFSEVTGGIAFDKLDSNIRYAWQQAAQAVTAELSRMLNSDF